MTCSQQRVDIEEYPKGIVIVLADGKSGNHLGPGEIAAVADGLDKAERAKKRWVVIRQRGRDFCLGRTPSSPGASMRTGVVELVQRLPRLKSVAISVADGGCVGMGVGLLALADVSLVTSRTWFQFPEILHGTAPAIVAAWLYDVVPYKQALYWTLTGARFGALQAQGHGLVNQIIEVDQIDKAVSELCAVVEELSERAVENAKTLARAMSVGASDPAVKREMALRWFS